MKDEFAVIFDMDGVIVDSNPVHRDSIIEFCSKHGIDVSKSFLRERVYGRTNSEWVPELFPEASESRIQRLSDEKEALFRQMFDPEHHVVKGLLNLVEELQQREVPMAVATSAPLENERYILKQLGIREKFGAVLHSSHVDQGKPAPDIYLKAAQQIDIEPTNCIVFEDSLPGARAALEAGCHTVGVTTTYSSEELNNCHRTIRDFAGVDYTLLTRWMEDRPTNEELKKVDADK